jgi:hypothetical protein
MLTGTPLDLTPFGGVLGAIGTIYWLLVLAGILAALWFPKNWLIKIGLVALIIGITVPPVIKHNSAKKTHYQQVDTRLTKAMAHYEMRCKSAGEKITKTIENVEGVFLMKLRPSDNYDYSASEQFKMNDPYGDDYDGDGLIESFFWGRNKDGRLDQSSLEGTGYKYVDAIDPKDKNRYRYTGYYAGPSRFILTKTLPSEPMPRYGVTYDDISTSEDRELWVAGSSLRVIDLKTNEVIAERIGYMIDKGQGSEAGFRQPWRFAAYNACPAFPTINDRNVKQAGQTRNFVEKVLTPINSQGQK